MGKLIGSVGLAPGSDEGTDLTTKGDLHGYSSSNTRIPIGSDDQVLTADSPRPNHPIDSTLVYSCSIYLRQRLQQSPAFQSNQKYF